MYPGGSATGFGSAWTVQRRVGGKRALLMPDGISISALITFGFKAAPVSCAHLITGGCSAGRDTDERTWRLAGIVREWVLHPDALNLRLEAMSAEQRMEWAAGHAGDATVLSSSFGAQAAVSLHGDPRAAGDSGHPGRYRLSVPLDLPLRRGSTERLAQPVHLPLAAVAGLAGARYDRLWSRARRHRALQPHQQGRPMRRALDELQAQALIAGLRRQQAKSRSGLSVALPRNGRLKVHPIIDWTDRDVGEYLRRHDSALPPALGAGLHVNRRRAHDHASGRWHDRGRNALFGLRASASAWSARARLNP